MHACVLLDVYLDSTNFGFSLVSPYVCGGGGGGLCAAHRVSVWSVYTIVFLQTKYRDRAQERRVLVGYSAIVPEWKKKIDQEIMLHNHK